MVGRRLPPATVCSTQRRSCSEGRRSSSASPPRAITPSARSASLAPSRSSTAPGRSPQASSATAVSSLQRSECALALVLDEPLPQEVAKEIVVAIRAAAAGVEGEHLVPGEEVQVARGAARSRQALGELSVDVLEAAGAQEEALDLGRLALEHLLRQVREDVHPQARVAERLLERGGVEPGERHAGEHHARRPSLREGMQAPHVFGIVLAFRTSAASTSATWPASKRKRSRGTRATSPARRSFSSRKVGS